MGEVKVGDLAKELKDKYGKSYKKDSGNWFFNVLYDFRGGHVDVFSRFGVNASKSDIQKVPELGIADFLKDNRDFLKKIFIKIYDDNLFLFNVKGGNERLITEEEANKIREICERVNKMALEYLKRKEISDKNEINLKDIYDGSYKKYNKSNKSNEEWFKEVIKILNDNGAAEALRKIANFNDSKLALTEDEMEYLKTKYAVKFDKYKDTIKTINDCLLKNSETIPYKDVATNLDSMFSEIFDESTGHITNILKPLKTYREEKEKERIENEKEMRKLKEKRLIEEQNLKEYYARFKRFVSNINYFFDDDTNQYRSIMQVYRDYEKKVREGLNKSWEGKITPNWKKSGVFYGESYIGMVRSLNSSSFEGEKPDFVKEEEGEIDAQITKTFKEIFDLRQAREKEEDSLSAKKAAVVSLTRLVNSWSRALGPKGEAVNLQAGAIYDTITREITSGIEKFSLTSYINNRRSKTAEWLKKIEKDARNKYYDIDPIEYVVNFKKNVDDLPSFSFKKAAVNYSSVKEAIKNFDEAINYRIERLAGKLVAVINRALTPNEEFRENLKKICEGSKFQSRSGYVLYFLPKSEKRKKLDAVISAETPRRTVAALDEFEKTFNKYLKNNLEKNGIKIKSSKITLEKIGEEGEVNSVALKLDTSSLKDYLNSQYSIDSAQKSSFDDRKEGLTCVLNAWSEKVTKWDGKSNLNLIEDVRNVSNDKDVKWGSSGETEKWLLKVVTSYKNSVKNKLNPIQILEEIKKTAVALPKRTFKKAVIKDENIRTLISDFTAKITAAQNDFQSKFKQSFEAGFKNLKFESNDKLENAKKNAKKFLDTFNEICSKDNYSGIDYFQKGTQMSKEAQEVRSKIGDLINPKGGWFDFLKSEDELREKEQKQYKNDYSNLEKLFGSLKGQIAEDTMVSIDVKLPKFYEE